MKKIYLSLLSMVAGIFAMGQQTQVIADHFAPAVQVNPPEVAIYNFTSGNGYVSGSNGFNDFAVVQLFDTTWGVPNNAMSGSVTNIKVYIAAKDNASGNGSIDLGVWENNGGTPGALIQSESIDLSNVDTSQANLTPLTDGGGNVVGIYNVDLTLSTPASYTGGSFFAGVALPDTASADTAVVLTTSGQNAGVFSAADTHAGTVGGQQATYFPYGDTSTLGLDIANAIFPTVSYSATSGVEEDKLANMNVYPNPARTNVTFDFAGSNLVQNIRIMNVSGSVVNNVSVNGVSKVNVDVSELSDGFYMYQIVDNEGQIVKTNKFVKR